MHLRDILESINLIAIFLQEIDFAAYQNDLKKNQQ